MMIMRSSVALLGMLLAASSPPLAQSLMDRKVGPARSGAPVEFEAFTTHLIGELASAAGVPIAFEYLLDRPEPTAAYRARRSKANAPIRLTGLRLEDAIRAMVGRDPRYHATEEGGVVVFRADTTIDWQGNQAEPLFDATFTGVLDVPAPAVKMKSITGREALGLAMSLINGPEESGTSFGDSRTFTLDSPAGTVRSLLNAIARAHGQLAWILSRNSDRSSANQYCFLFMSGPHGAGPCVTGRPRLGAVDATLDAPETPPGNMMDTIVGKGGSSSLELFNVWPGAMSQLHAATGVPMGLDLASGPLPSLPLEVPGIVATGLTLRRVLDLLVSRDPRYEWRDLDGVIVVRPVTAWSDSTHPLFAQVPDVVVDQGSMSEALQTVVAALGGRQGPHSVMDSRRVAFTVTSGTALDLLNALARAHGSLMWSYERADRQTVEGTGLHHTVTFFIQGRGYGVPVR